MSFNILMVIQSGRLSAEAVLALASLREVGTDETRITLAEPQPGPLWATDPRISDPEIRSFLTERGARIVPLRSQHFGSSYPHGNKIEALNLLPADEPFIFFDTDTLFLNDPLVLETDFTTPTASLRRSPSWPKIETEDERAQIWKSLYTRFGLEMPVDPARSKSDWQRIPYYNAGWILGPCPHRFQSRFLRYATEIKARPGVELTGQSLDPWLDQIALPLAIAAEGGHTRGVTGLDEHISCHYRTLPLLFAREDAHVVETVTRVAARNRTKKLLKRHPAFHQMLYRGGSARVQALFAEGAPTDEADLRKRLRAAGLWMR
ncbi:hypothetical protein [Pontivivens insulae]|uniref:Nucleotide-diphospho-sugar transferase domain-containing protein n=1 Tax=Pontivivens insulae TaxID=1639689 RepID=A0A2R8A8F0_9RHOB|nr:hypothetical protein [Pontivivens insulae]RED18527.1 hypothetical protein DFR53_0723 [Pontivivens insulae]SPF28425.1 hypothetical protein POI8812_00724 [Pontivivens insulae]